HAGQAFLQPGKLFPQSMRHVAFDLPTNLGDTDLRVDIKQEMDVIRHDFHTEDTISIYLLLLQHQLFQAGIQRRMKGLAPGLRTEDHTVLATIDDGGVGVVLLRRLFKMHSLPLSLVTMHNSNMYDASVLYKKGC